MAIAAIPADFGIQRVFADGKGDFLCIRHCAVGCLCFDEIVIAERQITNVQITVLIGIHCFKLTVFTALINTVACLNNRYRLIISRK